MRQMTLDLGALIGHGDARGRCADCVAERLRATPGVARVDVLVGGRAPRVRVGYDEAAVDAAGLRDRARCPGVGEACEERPVGPLASLASAAVRHRELTLVLAGGVLLAAGFAVHRFGGPAWLRLAVLLVGAVLSSAYTFPEAVRALRRFALDVDVLMFAAAAGAAALGHHEEGVFLLFLFGVGSAGERLALGRARAAIRALSAVAPEEAVRLGAGEREETVRVEDVGVGDRVVVRPFGRVAVDGVVEDGRSAVDQAPITGESVPVEKGPGDEAFAGTINGGGRLIVRATKPAGESTLARVVRLVEEAQAQKSPTQLFTDRIEQWYVPAVFVATVGLLVLPPTVGGGEWGVWFYRAMAFLTAASPCALAIGTPAAVLCGVARAAQLGVLIKGGAHLAALGRVRAVAFDKTGTLTQGRPTVTRLAPAAGWGVAELLRLAAAVERHVSHPLAEAVTRRAEAEGVAAPEAAGVEQLPGFGAMGRVEGRLVRVGRPEAVLAETGGSAAVRRALDAARAEGATGVAVSAGGELVGLIAVADGVRPEAAEALAALRDLGVRDLAMLTGDHPAAAGTIAARLGIGEVRAGLLPEDKLRIIRALAARRGAVAMVGDGVNDAPALAAATVGVAMGGRGPGAADVAMETADVVLMGGDLRRLPCAVALSRKARRVIAQNLVIALGTIAVVSPLAALGWASLGVAVVLHEGSTVVVVLNALRVLGWGRGRSGPSTLTGGGGYA